MKKITIVILLMSLFNSAYSQNSPILRTSIGVEKKLNKKLSLETKIETRFYTPTYKDAFAFNYFRLFELGANYNVTKSLSASVFYRYGQRKNNEFADFEARSRYFANLSYQAKFGKFRLNNRLRYQQQYRDNNDVSELQSSFLRYKMEGSFKLNKQLSPYAGAEIFYKIQDQTVDQLRLSTGMNYKINKRNGIEIGVFQDFNTTNTGLFNIEAGYKFDF